MEKDNVIENSNEIEKLRIVVYKEEDINKLIQMLVETKFNFENIDLFYVIKTVLLNPLQIDFEQDNESEENNNVIE